MSVHIQPLSTLPQLRGLLEVTRLVRGERDLTRLVDAIAATIADSLGFRTVAINLYRPAEGDFMVTTVHGSDGGARGAARHDAQRGRLGPVLRGALSAPRRLSDPARRDRLGGRAVSHPRARAELRPRRLAPRGRADGADAGCGRNAARRRLGRRARVRAPPDRRGDRRARRLRGARDRRDRSRSGRRTLPRATVRRSPSCSTSRRRSSSSTRPTTSSGRSPAGSRQALEFEKVAVCLAPRRSLLPVGNGGLGAGRSRARLRPRPMPTWTRSSCRSSRSKGAT